MAMKFRETKGSRDPSNSKKDGKKLPFRAIITGATDAATAEDHALANMPSTLEDTLVLQEYKLSDEGAGVFYLEAEYATDDEPPQGDGPTDEGAGTGNDGQTNPGKDEELKAGFSLDISADSVHITQALSTTSYFRVPLAAAPDVKNIIGLSTKGIDGCDIIQPKTEMTLVRTKTGLTLGYIETMEGLVGHTNNAPFWGREIGEVLYLGCSIQESQPNVFTLTHKFSIAKNLTWDANNPERVKQLTIGGITLNPGGKKGHQYVWVMYEPQPNAVDNITIEVPRYAFVCDVYPSGNLGKLGL